MKKRMKIAGLFLFTLPIAVHAQTITDDFTTSANWGAPQTSRGNISVGSGRMNYTAATTGDAFAAIARNTPILPVTRDWSLQVDAHLDSFTLTQDGQFSDLFLGFGKTGSWINNAVLFEFGRGTWSGPYGGGYYVADGARINGVDVPWEDTLFEDDNITSPDVSLRMDYSAAARTLTYYLDSNGAAGGYNWVSQGAASLAGGAYNLNLKETDTFTPLLIGSSELQTVSAGQAYLDNLVITVQPVATGTLTIVTNGVGTVARTPIGVPEVGKTYTLTATAGTGSVFSNWTGDVTGTNRVVSFVMTTNMTITTNFKDILKPTVAITSPTALQRILGANGLYTVRGTAADNLALSNVMVRLNGGSWEPAGTTNGLKNWSLPVQLTPGTNTISAYSVDTTSNSSLISTVKCVYVETGTLIINTNGVGAVTRSPAGAPEVGKTYTLTATAGTGSVFSNWTGDVTRTNKAVTFVMTNNVTIAANFTDTAKPTVAITSPAAALRISNEVYTVKGTATDNGVLTNVLCRINGGAWTNAMTTNSWKNWSVPVVLREGSNLVQACSVDSDKNVSSFASVSCTYVVTALMTVETNGLGNVNPNYNGQTLEIGRNYTMTATPGAGSVFIDWTCGVGGEAVTNKSTVTFAMQSNLVLTANFLSLSDLSEDGLSALSGFMDTNSSSYGDALLLADAAEAFRLAAAANPTNYANRIYNAVAIMLNLVNDPAVRSQAAAYGLNLDDLFDPTCVFSRNAPSVDVSVDNLAAAVLPAIDKAWTELNAVPATWAGRIEISTNQFPVDESVWIDAGDVTAMKAALKGLRAFVGLLKAYSLNVNYNLLVDPVATPQKTITVDGSVADWTNVPRSLVTFDYQDGMGTAFAVTQEVAVALDGTNIALLVTGCPFAISDTFWVGLDLRLSNGNSINSNRNCFVDLWTSGSVIYGMADGLKIDGLETALVNGVLEVKFPVQDGYATSQVTIEEVECGMNMGGPSGYWEDVLSLVMPGDTPIPTLRANHPEFFSKVRNTTSLAGAKTDLQAALNGYLAADTLIGKRSTNDVALHFVDFDPSDPLATEARLEKRNIVAQMLASLSAPVQMEGNSDIEGTLTRSVFLGALFNAPYITTNVWPSGLKGTLNNPSWTAFPNPTFNGALPGMTSTNLAKYLLGYTGANVETIRNFSTDEYGYAYELLFYVATSRRNMTITNVTVSGTGVPQMNLDVWETGWWGYYDVSSAPSAAGTKYTFTVEFADGSRETIYDAINAWVTVDPKPVLTGTILRWSGGASVPNADHYSVYTSCGNWDLPLTQTSLDLSAFGYVAGEWCWFTVDIVSKNWDIATHSGEYPAP